MKPRRSPSSSKPRTPAAAPEDQDILAKAKKIVETDPDIGSRSVLVVAGEGWHRGVIGIVASKLVDAFYRPAIVLSIDGDIAHGSCRSITGFNMLACLESCAPLMKRFGGHKAAAGLQLETSRIKEFRQAVNAHADTCLGPDDLRPSLWLDGPLAFSDINERVMAEFARAGAVWPGQPAADVPHRPGVAIVDGPRILKERHLKMSVKQNGRVLRAIQWNAAEREPNLTAKKDGVEIAYTVEENEYQGNEVRGAQARRLPLK